jgi:hypothetical protein
METVFTEFLCQPSCVLEISPKSYNFKWEEHDLIPSVVSTTPELAVVVLPRRRGARHFRRDGILRTTKRQAQDMRRFFIFKHARRVCQSNCYFMLDYERYFVHLFLLLYLQTVVSVCIFLPV